MKPKKILVLHSSSDLYGASNSLLRSLMAIKKLGMEPTLLLSETGPLCEKVKALDIPVQILRLGVIRRKYFNFLGLINRKYYITKAIFKIKNLIQEEGFELVLTNTTVIFSGAIAAKLSGIKHVWHVRETIVGPRFFKSFITFLLNTTGDANFFVSKASRDNYLPQLKIDKCHVIYNGIDYGMFVDNPYNLKEEIGVSQDKVLITMVARINLLKGQKYFLEIAKILLRKNNHLHFVLAGDTFPGYEHLHEELKSFIKENGLADFVTDLGFRSDVYNLMGGTDIFVLPSTQPDSLPTTVLEAMAAGKPVIATGLGGSVEMVIDGKSGLIIPHEDSRQSADQIQILIDDQQKRMEMGRKGQERLKEFFSIDAYLKNFGKAIYEVINDKNE